MIVSRVYVCICRLTSGGHEEGECFGVVCASFGALAVALARISRLAGKEDRDKHSNQPMDEK